MVSWCERDQFILDHDDLTPEEIDYLRSQCSSADEYHDVVRALADYRGEQ
jgi:hypothetical protein